jgi:hypothetical protein
MILFVNVILFVDVGVHIGYPYGRYGRGPGFFDGGPP